MLLASWPDAKPVQDTGEPEVMRELFFQHLPAPWVLGLVIVPAILGLAFLAYRHPKRDRPLRRVLAVLRMLLLATALVLILGPFFRQSRHQTEPAPIAVLLDDSASLQRSDSFDAGTMARLQQARLSEAREPQRLELARSLMASPWRETLEQRYQLQAYRFSERLSPTAVDGSGLAGNGGATALGDALLALVAENRGRRLPDIVLVSDGRSNRGQAVEAVAKKLSAEGVRVHAVALGDPRPAPDLSLERVQVPEVVLEGDEALFLLRLRASGENLPPSAWVRLKDENDTTLAEERVALAGEAGSQIALSARLDRSGIRRLTAEVDPVEGETARDNNELSLSLEVKEVQIRILYVEDLPRWEYRYIKNRLTRSDRDILIRAWLADAGRDFIQEATPNVFPLQRVPFTAEELLEDYDVIIMGDVDPSDLDPDPLAGLHFIEAVAEFVRRGGGLLVLAGPRHSPQVLVGTPLEPMLPVILGNELEPIVEEFRPRPLDPLAPHPVAILESDLRRNRDLWEKYQTDLLWYRPVERLRPGAQAWLVHPEQSNAYGPHVIAAGGYVPEGWVGWIGTDETWRWRFPRGEYYVERFWRTIVRNLATSRLRGSEGKVRLDVDRTRVEIGNSLTVEARLRDDAYQPIVLPEGIEVFLEGRTNPIPLSPIQGQAGIYRGQFRPSRAGPALLVLTEDGTPDGEIQASARFTAVFSRLENRETSQDRETLELLTRTTQGKLVAIDRADELLDLLDGKDRLTRTLASRDDPLDGEELLALFLVLACAEWLLRKRANLT